MIVTRERPTARPAATVPGERDGRRRSQFESGFPRHRDAVGRGGRGLHGHRRRRRTPDNGHRAGPLTDNLLDVTLSTPIYKDQAVVVSYDSAAAGSAALVTASRPTSTDPSQAARTAFRRRRTIRRCCAPHRASRPGWRRRRAATRGSTFPGPRRRRTAAPPSPATRSRSRRTARTPWTDVVADTGNTDTRYSHTGLSPGSTRHYRVSAINAVGTSDASDVVSGTTATSCTLNTGDRWCGVVTVGNRDALYGFLPPFFTLPGDRQPVRQNIRRLHD